MKKQGFRGRGIIGRWFYSMPEDRSGFRTFDNPPLSPATKEQYTRIVQLLAAMQPPLDEFYQQEPWVLHFSPEANLLFWEFAGEIEYRQRPGEDLEDMKDWASKLHGFVARISALLHFCWTIEEMDAHDIPISGTIMKHALDIALYGIHHAKATFEEMGADETMNKARRLVEWIKRMGCEDFTKRQAHMQLPHIFMKSEDMDNPLKLLIDRGYIREHKPEATRTAGRKPGSRFEVNPRFWNDRATSNVIQVPFEEVNKKK
jgi:hypothetical protein